MNSDELRYFLEKYKGNFQIKIYGCYGSAGIIEKIYFDEEQKIIVIESDICSG